MKREILDEQKIRASYRSFVSAEAKCEEGLLNRKIRGEDWKKGWLWKRTTK
jgi:hypothetical protein